jgi:predicted nucleic acid-binding Zn ribbon protein
MKNARGMTSALLGGLALVLAGAPAFAQLSGYYRITARHSGKAVAVQSASTSNSANVFQWTYGGAATNDEWELRSIGSGYYRVINRNSGKDMTVQSASTSEGANIFQYTYGGTTTNDEWALVDLGTGYYRVTNRNSGKSAEVAGGGTTDGANVDQRTYSGATYQQFQLVSLGGGTSPTPTPTPRAMPTATPRPTPTPGGPTSGWTQSSWTYSVHKPWDLAVSDRFSYSNGLWRMWVYASDQPHEQNNTTAPRTEMRWNNNYTSGNHMFDGDVYIPSPTSGVCFQQVFGGSSSATSSMTLIRGGTVTHYNSEVIRTNGWDNWWNLKVSHDADNNVIRIYDNNTLKFTGPDHGDSTHYFKNGVYSNTSPSSRMESQWKNLKYWKR